MSSDGVPSVAVVGRAEVVMPFAAAGIAALAAEPGPEALAAVKRLADGGCRVIFYTDDLAESLAPLLERYRRQATPSIVELPSRAGGHGIERLRQIVRRAVGADVFRE